MDVISRQNAALDGRYRIERQLGEGGWPPSTWRSIATRRSMCLRELEIRQRRPAESLPWLTRAVETFDWVLERAPKHATGRFYQSYTLAYQAQALHDLRRYPAAVAAWQRAIRVDDRNDPARFGAGWRRL